MIIVEDAQKLVLDHTPVLSAVEKQISEVNSYVLAEDVKSAVDVPLFSNSAMDGYALRSEDVLFGESVLKVKGCIQAGDAPNIQVGRGEAVKIMTGAHPSRMVPMLLLWWKTLKRA